MLQKMSAQSALVLRDNHPTEVEASELVPGDIILLEAGDIVPADGRLLESSSLKTEEAALTGESHSVEKIVESADLLLPAVPQFYLFRCPYLCRLQWP